MTAPRQVRPGTSYLVTRRCTRREFLLRPSSAVNRVFGYLLAVAAERTGVEVHAYCVLSNHFHLVVTDRHARLPSFHQLLDGLVARALNAHHGRWESFWAPSSYSAVVLETPDDIVEKCAYVLANPVAAGLVPTGSKWPGLWSAPDRIGGERSRVERPEVFFSARGSMPIDAALRTTVPPGFASTVDFLERLVAAVSRMEEAARREHRAFLGVERILAQHPTSRPHVPEPRRELNPRIGAIDKWKRLEAIGRLREFVRAHREALETWRAGDRQVIFPAGTYLMRVAHGAACVEA